MTGGRDDTDSVPTQLVQADEQETSFPRRLRGSSGGMDPDAIGPYRILERLGAGGMGVVFLAEQSEPVKRRVALKVIKAGMDTEQIVARFHAEQRALALMNHPNIARILDSGATEEGRPFFVMEHVQGVALNRYCDSRRLSIDQRLELFLDVCNAVLHAHQKGVIHRDLKPSNILVVDIDGKPSPRVIDFGIAKALHEPLDGFSVHTQHGGMLGTPLYISPEQAGRGVLDLDTRVDVYGLGVVLYELLVGVSIFDRASLDAMGLAEMQRTIREEEPLPPSRRFQAEDDAMGSIAENRATSRKALVRRVRGDLDWIVMKTIEKDRDRRYSSVAELAADLRRSLDHEPVIAGPPSARYRLAKFARRHRAVVLVGVAMCLAVILGLTGLVVGLVRAREATERSERAAAFLSESLGQVDTRRLGIELEEDLERRVRAAGERKGASPDQIEERVERLRVAMAGINAADVGLHLIDKEILARAGARVEESFENDPALASRLELTLGKAYHQLGLLETAVEHSRRAVDLSEDALGRSHPKTLATRHNLGVALYKSGEYEEAEGILLEVQEARERRLGARDPLSLQTASVIGNVRLEQDRFEEAETIYRRVLEEWRRTLGEARPEVRLAKNNLAILLKKTGRIDEAAALHRENLEAEKRLLGEDHPDVINTMNNLANVLWQQGRLQEAETLYQDGLERSSRSLGEAHPETLRLRGNLAETRRELGHLEEAEALLRENRVLEKEVLGHRHPTMLRSTSNLAGLLEEMKRFEEAEELLRSNWGTAREVLGESHQFTALAANQLAWLLLTKDSTTEVEDREALGLARFATSSTNEQDPNSLDTLSLALFMSGDLAAAVENQQKAISLVSPSSPIYEALQTALVRYEAALAARSDFSVDPPAALGP